MKKRAALLFGIIAAVYGALYLTPPSHWLQKESVLGLLEYLSRAWWGPVAFVGIYALACALAIPGLILTLCAGVVFGTFWGTVYNTIAANAGATVAFLLARALGRGFVEQLLRGSRFKSLDKTAAGNGFRTILTLRLIPLVPFNGLNFAAGLSKINYRDYFMGSLLGMLPATFIYTYFANALFSGAKGAGQEAFRHVLLAGTLLILISLLPTIFKKKLGKNP